MIGRSFARALRAPLMVCWVVVSSLAALAMAPLAAFALEHGRAVYNARCYYCHGYAGDARTVAASYLNPPPRDFSTASSAQLTREHMIQVVREGRAGTAMPAFSSLLSDADTVAVVDFVRAALMPRAVAAKATAAAPKATEKLGYHSVPNGWTGDPHASAAAPFVSGELSLDTPVEGLSARQAGGRALFLSACISCHDRGQQRDSGPAWRNEAVSYPLGNYVHVLDREFPAEQVIVRPATAVFDSHSIAPAVELSAHEREGAQTYAANCAFCHAADGSGRNWFGSFVEPAPPDFARAAAGPAVDRATLVNLIRDGVVGGAMPAWRNVLDARTIEALADYMRRAFPRFQPKNPTASGAPDIPDQKSLFQDSGNSAPEKPRRPEITFRSVPIRP